AFVHAPGTRRLRYFIMTRLIRCGSSSFRPISSVSGLLSPPRLAAGQAPDRSVVNRPIRRVGLSPTNSPASLAAAAHLDTPTDRGTAESGARVCDPQRAARELACLGLW